MPLPDRKTHALSHNRVSQPGSTYFLTLTSSERKTGLTTNALAFQIKDALRTLHREKVLNLVCCTIMPEHVHILAILGEKLTLSQAVPKLKVITKKPLQSANLTWHRNYYDHRLRRQTNTDTFARYIFLNPYRRKLLPITKPWSHWILNRTYRPNFLDRLEANQLPPPEWLSELPPLLDLVNSDHP